MLSQSLPSFPLLFLSSTVAGTNGSFVAATEPFPQEKGTPGSAGRGTNLSKREVKKVSHVGSGCHGACRLPWVSLEAPGMLCSIHSPRRGLAAWAVS